MSERFANRPALVPVGMGDFTTADGRYSLHQDEHGWWVRKGRSIAVVGPFQFLTAAGNWIADDEVRDA